MTIAGSRAGGRGTRMIAQDTLARTRGAGAGDPHRAACALAASSHEAHHAHHRSAREQLAARQLKGVHRDHATAVRATPERHGRGLEPHSHDGRGHRRLPKSRPFIGLSGCAATALVSLSLRVARPRYQ